MRSPRPTARAPIRIALADDQPIFRDGLRLRLTLEPDFEVVAEAASGQEAVEILQKARPDILLLDLIMPGLDGLSVLQRVQRQKLKTKIIVLTGSEEEKDYVWAVKYGAAGIVLKQTAPPLLVTSIRKVYQGEIRIDPKTTAAVMRQYAPPGEGPSGERKDRGLSRREREVIKLVADGLRNRDIAAKLFIGEQTVKNHLSTIFQKLGVTDRLELALYALHHDIRPED